MGGNPTMDDTSQKKNMDATVIENVSEGEDPFSQKYRNMERKILWKFDLHILPPLALVRLATP